jgi:hypothetical protein
MDNKYGTTMQICKIISFVLIGLLSGYVLHTTFPECLDYKYYGPLYFRDHDFSDLELFVLETFCRRND